jgi:hypothetical protein
MDFKKKPKNLSAILMEHSAMGFFTIIGLMLGFAESVKAHSLRLLPYTKAYPALHPQKPLLIHTIDEVVGTYGSNV